VFFGADIRARKPFAAATGPRDKIYLLASPDDAGSASVIECDEHLSPRLILDLALPDAFDPRMIGITSDRIYLAGSVGKVVYYPLDPKQPAGQVIDSVLNRVKAWRLRPAIRSGKPTAVPMKVSIGVR
jgi:hypothetical protein